MKDSLEHKPLSGKILLLSENDTILEEYSIGAGRLSITPKEHFFLINFWVRAEYQVELPDGENTIVWGPTLEILTKTPENADRFIIKVPPWEEIEKEWDINYNTRYYNGWHNQLEVAELEIEKEEGNIFYVKFYVIPKEDERQAKIRGECEIQLSEELIMYW